MLCLAALTACSANSSAETADAAGPTRTVKDVDGRAVDVPRHPTRVVTLSEPTLDGAIALGVRPVGSVAGRGQRGVPHYLASKARGVPVVGTVSALDYEAIGKLKPDLILVDGTSVNSSAVLSVLRRVAPTVVTGYAGGDWRRNFDIVGRALGRDQQVRVVEDRYDSQVETARTRLTAYDDDTFSIVRWQGGSAATILEELPAGRALTDLGLRRPPTQDRRGRGHSEPVSLENLGEIDADYIFFGTLGGSSVGNDDAGGASDVAGARSALASATSTPGFDQLTAYKRDHIIPVDGSLWTSTGGPLLMSGLVDSVVKDLR